MTRQIIYLPILIGFLFNTACASLSSVQTGRTLDKGKTEQTFGGGTYSSEDILKSADEDIEVDDFNVPFLEYSYRRGFTDKIDAGVKLTIIGTINADVKYSLIDDEKWALAVGGGLGYLSYTSEIGDEESETMVLDFIVPLYASYDFTDKASVYLSPKYIFRSISGDASGSASFAGANLGTKLGKEWGVYLELGQFVDLGSDVSISQYNASLFWTN